VPSERVSEGIGAGLVAAAATAGVLIGFGRAHGAALQPLNAIAHMLFGTRAFLMEGFHPGITAAGLFLHVLSVVIWGVLFAMVTARLRDWWPLLGASALFAGAVWLVDYRIVPARLRPGFETVLSAPELWVLYIVLAITFAAVVHRTRAAR
jgi:hypothetical protein